MSENIKYNIPKNSIANSFAQAATTYDEYAALQKEVADSLLNKIDPLQQIDRILDIGSGTGYCTEKLRKIFPNAEIISLDIAEGMLAFTKNKSEITPVCADAELLPFVENSFDLIVSSLAIQWCQNYHQLFLDLNRILCFGGKMYLSTFGTRTLQELKLAWERVDDYVHVNHFAGKDFLENSLTQAGFLRTDIMEHIVMRHYDSLKQLSQELKFIGAHNMNQGQAKGLGGRGNVFRMKRIFESYFVPGSGIPVTYEVYYLLLGK